MDKGRRNFATSKGIRRLKYFVTTTLMNNKRYKKQKQKD